MKSYSILVLNGPNINMLGTREPEIYGNRTYEDLLEYIDEEAEKRNIQVTFAQSNHEGDLVDRIQQAYGKMDGIVFNPAAYTHTSVAILDALKATMIPTVEVHISQVDEREEFRKISTISGVCIDTIKGHGFEGYIKALDILTEYLEKQNEE